MICRGQVLGSSKKAPRMLCLHPFPLALLSLFHPQVGRLGLKIRDVAADGNCLFSAVSDQVYGTPASHADVRRDTMDFIEQHRADFEPFVEDDEPFQVLLPWACLLLFPHPPPPPPSPISLFSLPVLPCRCAPSLPASTPPIWGRASSSHPELPRPRHAGGRNT